MSYLRGQGWEAAMRLKPHELGAQARKRSLSVDPFQNVEAPATF
jgi:hypothetical protein